MAKNENMKTSLKENFPKQLQVTQPHEAIPGYIYIIIFQGVPQDSTFDNMFVRRSVPKVLSLAYKLVPKDTYYVMG